MTTTNATVPVLPVRQVPVGGGLVTVSLAVLRIGMMKPLRDVVGKC